MTSAFFPGVYGLHPMLIAATVGVALVGVVLWGSLIGSLLPLLLRRLGFDPATSSAPFVATLVDVTGLVIYFSVGTVISAGHRYSDSRTEVLLHWRRCEGHCRGHQGTGLCPVHQ